MRRAFVLLSVFALSCADTKWTDWTAASPCDRPCHQTIGRVLVKRQCQQCTDGKCHIDRNVVCDSRCADEGSPECEPLISKRTTCYNGGDCTGEGIYIGEWTPWRTNTKCPSKYEPCRRVTKDLFRECVLPAKFRDRSKEFECPFGLATTVQYCLCGRAREAADEAGAEETGGGGETSGEQETSGGEQETGGGGGETGGGEPAKLAPVDYLRAAILADQQWRRSRAGPTARPYHHPRRGHTGRRQRPLHPKKIPKRRSRAYYHLDPEPGRRRSKAKYVIRQRPGHQPIRVPIYRAKAQAW